MSAKVIVSLAVAGIAAAASVPTPLPCPPVVPIETTTTDCATATETESATPVEIPSVCSNLPLCLEGVMVPNVAYTVKPALYECAKKPNCASMKIWCEPKAHPKEGDEFDFWYACQDMPAIPEERKCTVGKVEYTVGVAYPNVKFDQEEADYLWCISEDEVVFCKDDDCFSTPELTPPGIEVQEKCIAPVVIPKPPVVVEPSKPRPESCFTCEDCTALGFKWSADAGFCGYRCHGNGPCFQVPQHCNEPTIPPVIEDQDCAACLAKSNSTVVYTYEFNNKLCVEGNLCPKIDGVKCAFDLANGDCNVPAMYI